MGQPTIVLHRFAQFSCQSMSVPAVKLRKYIMRTEDFRENSIIFR